MSDFDDIAAYLGSGKTLYTKARGTKFRAQAAGGVLVVESEKSGRKTFTPTQVEAARKAVAASAPPLDDRAVQVARSWVGAISDAMAGTANPARRPSSSKVRTTSPSASRTRKPAVKQTSRAAAADAKSPGTKAKKRPTTSSKAAVRTPAAKPTPARPRSAPRATPRPVPPPTPAGPSAAEIAVSIGREIAKAIGEAKAAPERTDDARIGQITDQLASLTTQIETLRAERDAALAQAAQGERQLQSWRSVATQVAGLATVALAPMPKHDTNQLPPEVADLLAQASKSWKSAPSGSVSASRSALERVLRLVVDSEGGPGPDGSGFADLVNYLWGRSAASGNLSETDLHLARSLYRRSSKSSHGEDGWKPTPLDALLAWSGALTIAQRAFGSGK
ncbi:MAG TPA: hypothetical protein VGK16_05405 [Candidatus Limnocylindrales bacterium]|jgi:hypothetical protein